jgi:predicted metal-dependent hydrolase
MYLYRGDKEVLKENADAIFRYVNFISQKRTSKGTVNYGLGDWCPVTVVKTPVEYTSTVITMDNVKKAAFIFDAIGLKAQKEFCLTLYDEFRDAARKYLPERLEQLSRQTGLPYNKCRVCALSGALGLYYIKSRNIDLEYSLILHRQDRLDAVLVHELCHNISSGHDRKFYDALLKYGGERLYRADTRGDSDTFPIY